MEFGLGASCPGYKYACKERVYLSEGYENLMGNNLLIPLV